MASNMALMSDRAALVVLLAATLATAAAEDVPMPCVPVDFAEADVVAAEAQHVRYRSTF